MSAATCTHSVSNTTCSASVTLPSNTTRCSPATCPLRCDSLQVHTQFSETGSQLTALPPSLWAEIQTFYHNNRHVQIREEWCASQSLSASDTEIQTLYHSTQHTQIWEH